MVDETGHHAPAAAQGGARCCRAGRLGAGRRAPLGRPLIKNPQQGQPAAHHRLEPANNGGKGAAGPRRRHARSAPRTSARRPDDRLPGHPGRRDQQVRRLADAADPPARRGRRRLRERRQTAQRRPTPDFACGGNFVAYSKICTHAGCPASLYEQQTNRLLCPCHQSQFDITDRARADLRAGHAAAAAAAARRGRRGLLRRRSRLHEPVGPTYWERRAHR